MGTLCAFVLLLVGSARAHAPSLPPIRLSWPLPVPAVPPLVVADPVSLPGADRSPLPGARQAVVDLALRLRRVVYRRGGQSPATGFDCSGLVRYVFRRTSGMQLPHSVWQQFRMGLHVPRSRLHAGDLVFFRTRGRRVSHVGVYLGDGRFLHAPAAGQRVRVDWLGDRYWSRRFAGARRLLAMPRVAVVARPAQG